MSDWIHGLPIGFMMVVIFGAIFAMTAAIYWIVMRLATEDRARAFKGISPGLLSPLGIIFGLLIAFTAAQVWSDVERANTAVNREASALRGVVLLARAFPPDADARLRGLMAAHIQEVTTVEWQTMADHHATLTMLPTSLADALATALALPTTTEGQIAAQREIVAQLENAADARRQRILVSRGASTG